MSAGKKVCLIDDEKDFTELLGTLLSLHGYQSERLSNAVQGLERLRQERFDLVVVDIMMPHMDGLTLIEHLRALPDHAKTPVFALSAKRLTDDERKFLLAKDIRFVQKPFEIRQLIDMIRGVLEGR